MDYTMLENVIPFQKKNNKKNAIIILDGWNPWRLCLISISNDNAFLQFSYFLDSVGKLPS